MTTVAADTAARRRDALKLGAQTVVALGGVALALYLLGLFFKPQIEAIGHGFVARFGYVGVAVGTFIADAFSVPVPPHAYMLAAIAGGASHVVTVVVVCASSLLAGGVGYRMAGRLSELPFLRSRIAAARPRLDPLFQRYGVWAVAIGTITPMPYSVLCYLAGLYRLPPRLFALLLLFRIPRILFFYVLIRMMLAPG